MEELKKQILDKKMDGYYSNIDDFKSIDELTVEITLKEYRDLIKEYATKHYDIDKAEKDKYSRDNENRNLKEKVKDLENLILRYKVKYGELEEIEEDC